MVAFHSNTLLSTSSGFSSASDCLALYLPATLGAMLEALRGYSPVGTSSSHAQQQQNRRRRLLIIGGGVAFLLVLLSGSHYARSGSSATFSEYYGASGKASSSSGALFSQRKVKVLHLIDKATEESTMDRCEHDQCPTRPTVAKLS